MFDQLFRGFSEFFRCHRRKSVTERRSNGGVDEQPFPIHFERLAQNGTDVVSDAIHLGEQIRFRACIDAGQENNKFVSAVACHCVAVAYCTSDATCDLLENLITGAMSEAVVDAFEPVKVAEEKAYPGFCPCSPHECGSKAVLQQRPIGQPCQGIVMRLLLGLLQQPYILECHRGQSR